MPHHIPPRGWAMVLARVGRRLLRDRFPLLSAGIAFFAVLSIAPVLLTAVSVYGAVTTPGEALEQLSGVAGVLPATMEQVVADQVLSITAASTEVHTARGLVALLLALWTATTAMTSLVDALTLAYDETETRPFPRLVGLSLVLVLASAMVLGGLLAGGGLATRALSGAPARGGRDRGRAGLGRPGRRSWSSALGVLYRVAPDRRLARWRWVSPGAVAATVLWSAASVGAVRLRPRPGHVRDDVRLAGRGGHQHAVALAHGAARARGRGAQRRGRAADRARLHRRARAAAGRARRGGRGQPRRRWTRSSTSPRPPASPYPGRGRVGRATASGLRARRGKSGLHRARWWVTPTRGDPRDSATERRPPTDRATGTEVRVKGWCKRPPACRVTGAAR